jgi:transcriptional regulator with XRE-family HTH domain
MSDRSLPVDEIEIHRLGEKLRAIRERAGLTLDEMAATLGKTGTARRSRVREWEIGLRTPSLVIVLRYARFADVPVDVLLDDELDLPPVKNSE